jgi:hypothetical protein
MNANRVMTIEQARALLRKVNFSDALVRVNPADLIKHIEGDERHEQKNSVG